MDADLKTQLQQVFDFTDQDLRENRMGKLSARQAARLRSEASRVLFLVLAVLGGLGFLVLISARSSSSELFLLLACLTVPALATFALTLGITESAISPRVVSTRTGQVHVSTPPAGYDPPLPDARSQPIASGGRFTLKTSMYSIVIEDVEFRLSMEEHAAIRPAYYTVYFVPTLNKIVALELVAVTDRDSAPLPVEIERPGLPAPAESPVILDALDRDGEDVRA